MGFGAIWPKKKTIKHLSKNDSKHLHHINKTQVVVFLIFISRKRGSNKQHHDHIQIHMRRDYVNYTSGQYGDYFRREVFWKS